MPRGTTKEEEGSGGAESHAPRASAPSRAQPNASRITARRQRQGAQRRRTLLLELRAWLIGKIRGDVDDPQSLLVVASSTGAQASSAASMAEDVTAITEVK